jgi:hypothetical protein
LFKKSYEIFRGVTNKTTLKNLLWTRDLKIKSTLDCDIKILNRLFSNQQVDV